MANGRKGELFGHPRGLYILFFTEMWERFSYYGMRALLVLYMVNYFKWTQAEASGVYKWYVSLVYLTPLLGGFLADRYLGNKWAIVIGGSLMAVGHFCMAFEQIEIFYAALIFLIIGNGFFKPNMSTQVGRLYPANDDRRDAAYTIFYMGINLGAFLSPIMCSALADGTSWGYHAGFALAGVGMVLGLTTYLIGLPWVQEIAEQPGAAEDNGATDDRQNQPDKTQQGHATEPHYMTEAEAKTTPSVTPRLAAAAPMLLWIIGGVALVGTCIGRAFNMVATDNVLAFGVGGAVTAWLAAWIVRQVNMAVRDRVLAILAVGVFVVFFWGAFEQAGNAMNVFADKVTNRYVTETAPEPSIYPEIPEEEAQKTWTSELANAFRNLVKFNPVPAPTFQAVNPFAIFVLAPLFAWLWVWLPRKGIHLSIPVKMSIGVALQAVAFALMYWSMSYESQPSDAKLAALPAGVQIDAEQRVVFRPVPDLSAKDEVFGEFSTVPEDPTKLDIVHGGRLQYATADGELQMHGVLADTDRDQMLRATVSQDYLNAVRELAAQSEKLEKDQETSVKLDTVPAGFDLRFAGFPESKVWFDADTQTLHTKTKLADKDYKMLLLAGAEPRFRDALNTLYITSAEFKVGVWWLVWFYILCTIGELCLSPVGLSMVSKLAPARFATMLMGMWLLTSFFGNYAAGLAGESWGKVHPATFFGAVALIVFSASLVCFLASRKVVKMMHGAR